MNLKTFSLEFGRSNWILTSAILTGSSSPQLFIEKISLFQVWTNLYFGQVQKCVRIYSKNSRPCRCGIKRDWFALHTKKERPQNQVSAPESLLCYPLLIRFCRVWENRGYIFGYCATLTDIQRDLYFSSARNQPTETTATGLRTCRQ